MADLENEAQAAVNSMAGDPCDEAQILNGKEGPKDTITTPVETKEPEQSLPKLSPADFKIYNNMAEHMDYFVSFALLPQTFVALY